MGLTVPDYMTPWGVAVPAYMSIARSDIQLSSMAISYTNMSYMSPTLPSENGWTLNAWVFVYRNKADRDKDADKYLDKIHVTFHVTASQLTNKTLFALIYEYIMEKHPNGVVV